MRYCHSHAIKVVPRGAGTSLSGGALPLADAVLVGLGKFNRILDIDYANRCVVAQPGVTNLAITHAVQADGFYYAPDPSSQIACSVGGNVAENSGGVHCLKYGLTTNNLLGIEVVTIEGEVLRFGGKHLDAGDFDLMGVMTGSEGLLGVVSVVTLRILQKPAMQRALLVGFDDTESAAKAVGDVIGAGIVPAGMEMMDGLAINAAEDFVEAGYPRDAGALLIIELDGPAVEVDALIDRVATIMNAAGHHPSRSATLRPNETCFGLGGRPRFRRWRFSPDYLCMDGTIPRRCLPDMMVRMAALSQTYGLRVANVSCR